MDSPPVVGNPAIAHLCDVILETLRHVTNPTNEITAFCNELQMLRKFLDLIDRVFKAKLSRMAFEEQHFTSVEVLLDRCRTSLSQLCEIFAALGRNRRQVGWQNCLQDVQKILQTSEVFALRARIGVYIQTLQMSLQTVNL